MVESLESEREIAAILLITCMMIFTVGGILFTGRTIWKWPIGQTPGYLRWERGFVILALLTNVGGLVLLKDVLAANGEFIISQLALITYLIGAVIVIISEMTYLHNGEWITSQIALHVVLAFLAQAAFGVALLQTNLVAAWVGWMTIIWNLAWLGVLIIFSPCDIYFPALHHIAPLVIGIALLAGK